MVNKRRKQEPIPLQVSFDKGRRLWFVLGAPKRLRGFETKMDAENYCIKQLGKCPVTIVKSESNQELPQKSVWTGAPWDKTFEHLNN
jgi:hypothetical protein